MHRENSSSISVTNTSPFSFTMVHSNAVSTGDNDDSPLTTHEPKRPRRSRTSEVDSNTTKSNAAAVPTTTSKEEDDWRQVAAEASVVEFDSQTGLPLAQTNFLPDGVFYPIRGIVKKRLPAAVFDKLKCIHRHIQQQVDSSRCVPWAGINDGDTKERAFGFLGSSEFLIKTGNRTTTTSSSLFRRGSAVAAVSVLLMAILLGSAGGGLPCCDSFVVPPPPLHNGRATTTISRHHSTPVLLLPSRHSNNCDDGDSNSRILRRPRRQKSTKRTARILSWLGGTSRLGSATDDDHDESSSSTSSSNNNSYSVESIQQRIVQQGLRWKNQSLSSSTNDTTTTKLTRVPGCVATVYILATTTQPLKDGRRGAAAVTVQGNADAIFSRGLLSLLKDFLESQTPEEIQRLDPATIADQLGVRPALSKGRNDGLANMVTIVQAQLSRKQQWQEIEDAVEIMERNDDPPRVALLLSGGVDSSVALRLLMEQGYDVVPFYLKIWLEDELAHLGSCPWEDDVATCRQVCEQAGVELNIISLQDEYHRRVMQHTLDEASLGRTPNPDILCNSRVKFGCFLEYLETLTDAPFDYIASGHYAQVQRVDDVAATDGQSTTQLVKLIRAPDPVKDQSYFLCALSQQQLQRLLFPVGHLEKHQVRELAEKFELPNRHRPDSQGLCFLGKVKFRDFMQSHLGESPGDIVDAVTGGVIGTHHGVWYHTVGQRKGIGPYLKPQATAFGPWYVVAKELSKNVVYASNRYDEAVFDEARSKFHVENVHWISGRAPVHLLNDDGCYRFHMKIRHGPKLSSGTLTVTENEEEGTVDLDQKDGGLAPGQYVVFYTDDAECLGGGIISERHWAKFLDEAITVFASPTQS